MPDAPAMNEVRGADAPKHGDPVWPGRSPMEKRVELVEWFRQREIPNLVTDGIANETSVNPMAIR